MSARILLPIDGSDVTPAGRLCTDLAFGELPRQGPSAGAMAVERAR